MGTDHFRFQAQALPPNSSANDVSSAQCCTVLHRKSQNQNCHSLILFAQLCTVFHSTFTASPHIHSVLQHIHSVPQHFTNMVESQFYLMNTIYIQYYNLKYCALLGNSSSYPYLAQREIMPNDVFCKLQLMPCSLEIKLNVTL
jgi:hypothetical protein